MRRPVLIGIGGHVVAALVAQLGAVPGLAEQVELHLAPEMPGGRADASAEVLGRAVLVLAEAGAMHAAERAALAPDCAMVTVPRVGFASLWPLTMAPRGGGVAGPFGDRIAQRVVDMVRERGASGSARRAAYDAAAREGLGDLGRLHADEARAMFQREEGCDIHVAAFVLSRFRAERLFHSAVHPAAPLLLHMMAQLLGHPALLGLVRAPYDVALAAVVPGLADVFADAQAPVHPAVAAHFALRWWSPGMTYRQGAQSWDFDGWVDWHLRDAEQPAAAVGAGLAAGQGGEVAVLHPATEIERVAPFFATAIDPAVARHGAVMLSAASGRYMAPASLMAVLDDAVVQGHAGAVLHRGLVLGDTVPSGMRVWPARTAVAQQIAEPCFLGFGAGWSEDSQLMLGVLPRLVALARLRRREGRMRLLLPDRLADDPRLRAMLALLGIAEERLAWLGDEPVACARLVVTTRFDGEAVAPYCHVAALALAGMVKLAPPRPRRLYLRQEVSVARLANESDVATILAARGFTVLDCAEASLAERIALLRHATAVVAARGPLLAEVAFCPAGAAVLELVGPADPGMVFWSLASCARLRYGYVVGEAVGTLVQSADFTIPTDMLEGAVATMTLA